MSKKNYEFSRRRVLQGAGAVAGAVAASRLAGGSFLPGKAHAQFEPEKAAVLIIMLRGGYNSLFCSADSFMNASFGVTGSNVRTLGNGLVVDAPTFGTMPTQALNKMASIGIRHGLTSHEAAQSANFRHEGKSAILTLASQLGGYSPLKAALLGTAGLEGTHDPVGGVSLQQITDMKSTLAALGGLQDPTIPNREIASGGLTAARAMSQREFEASPLSLRTAQEGYPAVIDTLNQPVKAFDFAATAQAYGMAATTTNVGSFNSQMLAAELMVHAGTNVIIAQNGGWDTHGDRDGSAVRARMNSQILPGLNVFLNRMMNLANHNVVVAMIGDFARSLPGSDHQANLTATVIGKYVQTGTTGRTDGNVRLPAGTPSIPGFWAYLAAATKAPGQPFGANPHGLIG